MKRSGPITRSTRLRARRATSRRSSRVMDPAYLAFLREDSCGVARSLGYDGDCSGPMDPEHERQGVGMGQKADDARAWSCCRKHHDERHALSGFFKGWLRPQLRTFIAGQIDISRARYARVQLSRTASQVGTTSLTP